MHNEEWWEQGRCRGANPAVFDGVELVNRHDRRDWSEARRLCEECTVIEQCLEFMLSFPFERTIDKAYAAGRTPYELRKLREERARRRAEQRAAQ